MWRLAPILVSTMACTDLLGIPEPVRGPCDPDAAFVHRAPVGGIGGDSGEQYARLSRDELTVLFSRQNLNGPVNTHGDLYLAHRDRLDDDFRDVTALSEVNSDLDEFGASLSDDLLTLYFDRQVEAPRYEIFAARRSATGDRFGKPQQVDLGNDSSSNLEPFITATGMAFASTRDGLVTLFTAIGHGTVFEPPRRLIPVGTRTPSTAIEHPVVAFDGLTVYFSAPPEHAVARDIWTASRPALDAPFGAPRAVTMLNTADHEIPASVSEDNCRLYFLTGSNPVALELWVASRRTP